MQRPTRALAVIAVGLGAILGAADGVRAAAPWSDPQAVPGGFPGGVEQLRFDGAGHGRLIGLGRTRQNGRVDRVLAAPVEGGRPGPAAVSTTRLDMTRLRLHGRDGVVAGGDAALARGRLGHPLGRRQPIRGRARSSQLLDLAVNEAGDAVAAVRWCRTRGCGRQALALFRWRAGKRISRPLSLDRGRGLGAGVAINGRGDIAIVRDRVTGGGRREVVGQILTAGGTLRRARRLGAARAAPRYRIALADDRRVVAAWLAQAVSECDARPGEIAVAQAARGGRFTPARRLAALDITGCGRYVSEAGVAFARGPDGRVLIAWSGNEGGRWVVRAGELGPSGVANAAVVSDRASDAVLSDLAVGPGGDAVILLADGVGGSDSTGPNRLLAVTRSAAAGVFGAPETVTDGMALDSVAAFDPATGRATVGMITTDAQFMPFASVVTREPSE